MFGLVLPPWLNPQLIGAALLAAATFGGGMWLEHRLDAKPLLEAQNASLQTQAKYDGYRAGVVGQAAQATAKTLQEKTVQDAKINDLQAQLSDSQRITDAKSKALRDLLASAKPGDARAIGPLASQFYDRVRQDAASGPRTP